MITASFRDSDMEGFAQTAVFSEASQQPLEVDFASHTQASIPPAHTTCNDDVQHNAIVKGLHSCAALLLMLLPIFVYAFCISVRGSDFEHYL
ncbi:hypothetical protein Tco_1541819 [Tanacetum coccineum]